MDVSPMTAAAAVRGMLGRLSDSTSSSWGWLL